MAIGSGWDIPPTPVAFHRVTTPDTFTRRLLQVLAGGPPDGMTTGTLVDAVLGRVSGWPRQVALNRAHAALRKHAAGGNVRAAGTTDPAPGAGGKRPVVWQITRAGRERLGLTSR